MGALTLMLHLLPLFSVVQLHPTKSATCPKIQACQSPYLQDSMLSQRIRMEFQQTGHFLHLLTVLI